MKLLLSDTMEIIRAALVDPIQGAFPGMYGRERSWLGEDAEQLSERLNLVLEAIDDYERRRPKRAYTDEEYAKAVDSGYPEHFRDGRG